VAKGGQILAKAAKAGAPKETGLLKKSIGSKVKVYPSGVAVAIVGPRQGFKAEVTREKNRRFPWTGTSNPTRYAHLVELGTRQAPAKPFLKPALAGQQAAIREAMAKAVREALGL
jgi:HK97 gp10 family phage protein